MNVTKTSATVKAAAHVTDNGPGVQYALLALFSPSRHQQLEPNMHLVSGTNTDGTYESTITIPPGSESGAWKARMRIIDIQGNETELTAPQLQTNGFPNTIEVEDVPTVSSVSPAAGTAAGGTSIKITGTGFLPGATVEIGQGHGPGPTTIEATEIVAVSPTEITATTGSPAKPGTWNVFVTDSQGTSHANPGDDYTYK